LNVSPNVFEILKVLIDAPTLGEPVELLDETYPAKTTGMRESYKNG